jgi:DNA-binding beta-propeller fold protein YncE
MFRTMKPSSFLNRVYIFLAAGWLSLSAGCGIGSADKSGEHRPNVSSPSDGFTNFETEPVRPIVLSDDGRYLYALNTADDRLEIFDASGDSLRSIGETTVGLRPVALVLRGGEAWVVNHLSDSVSVVDVREPARPRVLHTLQVGDEPRGIAVGGPNRDRVFVATARRDETLTPGVGRAQLWVFDARQPSAPAKIVTLFGSKPRALAVSADGRFVYATVFLSGNGTTTTSGEDAVKLGRAPRWSLSTIPYSAVPKQGTIVRRSAGAWRDAAGRDWNAAVPFELPDYDLFVIDATADEPRAVEAVSNVGTILFNLAVQPVSGEIWITNTDATNLTPHEPRLRGKFADNRVTRVVFGGAAATRVHAVDLNRHIDRSAQSATDSVRELSLAQPLDIVFSPDGQRAFVTAFGSSKVGILDGAGNVIDRINVGFGPGGLALDDKQQRLYMLNHLDATISVVDLRLRRAIQTTRLRYDPTPLAIRAGRPFFYDAATTSRYGDLSCASCHVFGDTDGLAWDLGDPTGTQIDYPVRLRNIGLGEPRQALHPLKGPMMTQSLRGLANTAPYHWRGDRFGVPYDPGEDVASFKDFNAAFVDLMGRSSEIADGAMEAFARFILSIRYPPNPFQRLDRSMDAEQKAGFDFFTGPFFSDAGEQNCVNCHTLPAGTNRLVNFEGLQIGRDMKTAQLRNLYDKVGRFNVAGPQVSGFSFLHDGTVDSVVSFLRFDVFFFPGDTEAEKDVIRRQLHHYIMAFDTGMAPMVGRQLTVRGELSGGERQMLHLMSARAAAGDCDLTARAWQEKLQRGWLQRDRVFYSDRAAELPLVLDDLLARYRVSAEPITFTCVPPGDGRRSAIDRDLDGHLDGDELLAGSDPADPRSVPGDRSRAK